MIDVGTMAGTGKTAQVAPSAVHGGPGAAVDEGAFRESLKASVGGTEVREVVAPALPAAKALSAPVIRQPGAAMTHGPVVAPAVPPATTAVAETAAPAPAKIGGVATKVEDTAGKFSSEDLQVAAPLQAEVVAGRVPVAAQIAKPVAGGAEATAVPGAKALKSDAGTVGKKAGAKSGEAAVVAPAAATEPASAVAVVADSVPVAVVQVVALAGAPVPVNVGEVQVQAPAGGAGGSGKATKNAGVSGSVRGTGREAKKVDEGVQAAAKAGPDTVALQAGGGVVAVKEGTAAVGGQGGVGTAAVASVGPVASHAGVTGVAGAKVAASVEAVTTPAQGGAQGPEVKTLAATPNLLEVGIESGTHGWLRVRAELGQTGEVTASMVASSAGQADTLRRELPAMSTYLAGESVGVSSLVVNATGAAAGAQDAAMSLGAGAQGGDANGRAQGGTPGAQSGGPDEGARGEFGRGCGVGVRRCGVAGGGVCEWKRELVECESLGGAAGLSYLFNFSYTTNFEETMMSVAIGGVDLSAASATVAQSLVTRHSAAKSAAAAASSGATGSTGSSSAAAASGNAITSNDFLTLLVTEMKNPRTRRSLRIRMLTSSNWWA